MRPRIWHKLLVICVAFTIPLVLTTHFLLEEKRIKIDFAAKELSGDAYLRPLSVLLEHLSTHRTLLHNGGGDPASLEARIDREFDAVTGLDARMARSLQTTASALQAGGREAALPATLAADWRALKGAGADPGAVNAAHDALETEAEALERGEVAG
jgi:hypothetical protein